MSVCRRSVTAFEVALTDCDAKNFKLPTTEMLKREVFTKQAKGETMVRKFVLLKTNKEAEGDEYPAYVMHYTDFSPNRKDPLSRDVAVSNSREQIEELYEKCKTGQSQEGLESCQQRRRCGPFPNRK